MNILRFEKHHIPALCELEKICFSSPWSEMSFEEELDNSLAVFLVAEDEHGVLGYVGCHFVCGVGDITNIAVHPDARRKGVAKTLMNALEAESKRFETEVINLEVRKSNLPAISLYKQLGYEECGERPNFYTKPTENAILMAKKVK